MSQSNSHRVGIGTRLRLRRQIAQLNRNVDAEALRIAELVRDGEVTRSQVEGWVREYGDGEPIRALEILDSWGIR